MQCASHSIPAQESVKYLEIKIDQQGRNLPNVFTPKLINARRKFLYRHGKYLNFNCRKLLCSALIQCLFDYANSNFRYKSSEYQNFTGFLLIQKENGNSNMFCKFQHHSMQNFFFSKWRINVFLKLNRLHQTLTSDFDGLS